MLSKSKGKEYKVVADYLRPMKPSRPPLPTAYTRRVGIEIEVEGCKGKPSNMAYWESKPDNSLREGGMEFISHPIPLKDVKVILDEFYKWFVKLKWIGNGRTGIHVHVDCRDFTPVKLATAATVYTLVEPALMEVVGDEREENIYCVPWYRADTDLVNLAKQFKDWKDLSESGKTKLALSSLIEGVARRTCKYSGMYFEPLRRFGTLEFRHAPTWYEAGPTLNWVNICHAIIVYASRCISPTQVLERYRAVTPLQFARAVIGPRVVLSSKYNDWVEECDVEILAETLAYALNPPTDKITAGKWQRIKAAVGEDLPDLAKPRRRGPRKKKPSTQYAWAAGIGQHGLEVPGPMHEPADLDDDLDFIDEF